jgi:epoxyqueuosine reductase
MTTTVETASLSQLIKKHAFEEGFDKVGIVRAARLDTEAELLDQWLGRHYHAGMKWMEREPSNRVDPREIFPAARSIIVVAINYYTPFTHRDSEHTGKISRYAWGDDYHEIISTKLLALLSWIKEQVPGAEGKVCVDIQPMMDKAWAVRAGLGWLGKHSNVITHEFGSWVFIGELLLNIELDYGDKTVEDHCGTCTLCIDACPTGAIVEPYVVDSNKCISYATIELREPEIAGPVAEKLSGWLYGCDICQDVCPWNRFEQSTNEERFEPREENIDANLADILELTPDSYAHRFRGSPMKRAKLSGLQRNARTLLDSRSRG